jgi:hypothetical protein
MGLKPRKRGASAFVDASKDRPDPSVVRLRLQERDQRVAADNRSEAERLLCDPPRGQSALNQSIRR